MQDPYVASSDISFSSRMRGVASQHEVKRNIFSNKIRFAHWRNYARLQVIRRKLSKFPPNMITLIPASRWLFDNYHLLYRNFKAFQTSGNVSLFRRLPIIKDGLGKGYPCIYMIAREMIAASNRHLTEDMVVRMVKEYQTVKALSNNELNLLPDMIVFCLLEKIIDESKKIIPAIQNKAKADKIMEKVAPYFINGDKNAYDILKSHINKKQISEHTFSSHLIYRLKSLSLNQQEITAIISEISGIAIDENPNLIIKITEKELLFESESESSISSYITSLDEISSIDLDLFISNSSFLEYTLGEDPSKIYLAMDKMTRAQYRSTVSKLANQYHISEIDVARNALNLAVSPPKGSDFKFPGHVGTYLFNDGKLLLRTILSGKSIKSGIFVSNFKFLSKVLYFLGISMLSVLIFPLLSFIVNRGNIIFTINSLPFYIFAVIPVSSFAIFVINSIYTKLIHPKPQFAMDFEKGIPDSCKTYIVIPLILASPANANDCASTLEMHYLVNRKDNFFFALLVDFKDAKEKFQDEDSAILTAAIDSINQLNRKYPRASAVFSLFYREREWNESQNCWMGWERKRGKLEAFNSLLMGEEDTGFLTPVADSSIFSSIKYIITLDSDTELTNGSASEMVGAMEHPLNQPVFDLNGTKIKSGYVIIQSEVRNRANKQSSGICQRIFSSQSGFDPYGTIVSDIYQDTFDEGIYAGKGIYNLYAFHSLLHDKIPDNQVLSHDLLEGSITRCAFASGIKLMNSVPSSVAAYIKREHRWIRGDWQLLPYIFGKSEINMLSRWKMIDNLRRSLLSPSQIFLFIANILIFPETSWLWIPFIFYEPVIHISFTIIGVLLKKARHPFRRVAYPVLLENISYMFINSLFFFILLPSRTAFTLDAIIRTLYRIIISKRNLLEWQTADSVERSTSNSLKSYILMMIPAYILASIIVIRALMPLDIPIRILFLTCAFLWFLSPFVSYLASKTKKVNPNFGLSLDESNQLRLHAAKIWSYFVDFSNEEHHWLCPDHHQESPGPKTEHKTSPTNIGLQLLSTLSARDLGFTGLFSFIETCERILYTLDLMVKWNGHLYNWYDTKTLQTLEPKYISTVDSGNFLGSLISLKNALTEIIISPVFNVSLPKGLKTLQQMDYEEALLHHNNHNNNNHNIHSNTKKSSGTRKGINLKNINDSVFITSKNISPIDIYLSSTLITDNTPSVEQITALYAIVDTFASTTDTGRRTLSLCSDLIQDKEQLEIFYLKDLLKPLAALSDEGFDNASALISRIETLKLKIDNLVNYADFAPLYDFKKQLFRIGYHESNKKLDRGHYNLMASEARLSSFIAIAKGDVPKRHWVSLGKPLTLIKGIPALVSWSGSMFEYLMPNIVLKISPNSILDYSCKAAVYSQIKYGSKMNFPWGISESQYHVFDNHSNYQYGPFGVGRMRLQSSLKPVKVIAPYATMLALGTLTKQAMKNIRELENIGASGIYGFYESLDYTSSDPSTLKNFFIIKSYMAHHLGMSITSINNVLNDNILQKRFHMEPIVKANESLLEDIFTTNLVTIASQGYTIDVDSKDILKSTFEPRIFNITNTPYPVAHILSNGHYKLLLSTQGDGFCSYDDIMINRWRPDFKNGGSGTFIYLRESESNRLWSNTFHPTMVTPDSYQAIFSHDKVEYRRTDGQINCYTEISISPVDPLEIRRVTLTNYGEKSVNIELTSYIEVAANEYFADLSHLAYSKLFIKSQYDASRKLLIASRRVKTPSEKNGFVMHQIRTDAKISRPIRFETSRQSFIGRGGSLMAPEALKSNLPFSENGGVSIDPILSLQVVITIPPGRSASVSFITAYCRTMAQVIDLSNKNSIRYSDDDIFKMARTNSILELEYLKIQSVHLNAIQDLVGALYYPTGCFKDTSESLLENTLGQSGCWRFGISGDQPIMLLRISEIGDLEILRDVLAVYEYLRLQKVRTDLIILNEQEDSYDNSLQQLIFEQTSTVRVFDEARYQSGIFILRSSQLSQEERILLLSIARIIFTSKSGIYFSKCKLTWPIAKEKQAIPLSSGLVPFQDDLYDITAHNDPVPEFFNGIGGFVNDGREYEIRLSKRTKTPAPWINVIANETFGFHISEIGAGYTWSGNSRENKLTTWYNDPVLDPLSEALYIKINQTGEITSPFAMKPGASGPFYVKHGFGYSIFEKRDPSLNQTATVYATLNSPVKLMLLSLVNNTDEPLDITLSYYAEFVLGSFREQTSRYIVTGFDNENQVLTARNSYTDFYKNHLAFLFASEHITSYSGDGASFFGENGTVRYPLELMHTKLSCDVGAGFDPCGVIQCTVNIPANSNKEVIFGLGQGTCKEHVVSLSNYFRDVENSKSELDLVNSYWSRLPGDVYVRTPDRAMDILMNGWLLYQVISCRFRAKSAFYQCGGAFGFRDQLQDVLSLVNFDSGITRSHILKCSSKQFIEGDVQHWWHEPDGIGVRTRISDNLLWLPFITAQYCKQTGDWGLLDDETTYLEENVLAKNQNEIVSKPRISGITASVYAHCVQAIDYSCRFGDHGLPLIKGGDWNDGMNLVGPKEQGESVWLGWFLISILKTFVPICQKMDDEERAVKFDDLAATLAQNIEKHAWDGEWYLRAFYDNGQTMGSAKNEDCRIDSISQTWAVISGGADKHRSLMALASAKRYLVKPEDGLVLLLTPPFDKDINHPGYIKGYNPGIRENGGQYTHAAVWMAMAYCEAGDGNEAFRILNMINPIQSTSDFQSVSHYEKEPYVMSADVSYGFPNTGKGGWSWYTGAAGWMYRTVLQNFLGINKEGNVLVFKPCIPSNFRKYFVEYRFGKSIYEINVLNDFCNGCEIGTISIDGILLDDHRVEMVDDGIVHHIDIRLSNQVV